MKPPIGFVIVTYNHSEQTLLLCERLNVMFNRPPISIHHDFSQSEMNTAIFPRNVRFVEEWQRTRWGSLTVVDAQLSALRLLYATEGPDWFVTLSTSDYPIQTADRILQDVMDSGVDAFMDLRLIKDLGQPFVNEGLGELAFKHPRYLQVAYNRYVAIPLISPRMAKRLRTPSERWCLRSKFLSRRLTPFAGSIDCYGGDSWFTANRDVANFLLDQTPLWRALYRHYKSRIVPEEAFYHTLLGNTPSFKLSPDNKRYTDWKGCYAHPRTLGREDFPRLLESTHHFARKFPFDPELLHDLDIAVANNASIAQAVAQAVEGGQGYAG